MKQLNLDHPQTPLALRQINHQLSELLNADEPDEAVFLSLATTRDDIIQTHLKTLEDEHLSSFVHAELEANGLLLARANELFKASLNQLSGLVRGRKAVEKYR